MHQPALRVCAFFAAAFLLGLLSGVSAQDVDPKAEAYLFTPPGFDKPGEPKTASGEGTGRLKIVVRDAATGEPKFCRVNVVGPDGHFYQPAANYLTPFSLTGNWPKEGKGNRAGKAPFRYFGRFFYSWGEAEVAAPAGNVRVEVWKGYEYQPQTVSVALAADQTQPVEIRLTRAIPAAEEFGYVSGDPHIHITRADDRDEQMILDLMEAEDIRHGVIMAYNEPAGPYKGVMDTLDMPQRGLGRQSVSTRNGYSIVSGQEYRSSTYGHLNLFLRDNLVLEGQDVNANNGPVYGMLGRETQGQGGFAFYAHGGYAQAIYADLVQGDVNGVELLQFGVYRGIGLEDWYHVLNSGFRFPAVGACDYPACRKLGDCKTYVSLPEKKNDEESDIERWLRGAAAGRSFVTTGPILLLDVDGEGPGAAIEKAGAGPHSVNARVRVNSVVAPIEKVQIIVGGKVIREINVPAEKRRGAWFEVAEPIEISGSSWIAARAYSTSPVGQPDAEAHTNPVYVIADGKAPYDRGSLDQILAKLDGQIDIHRKRDFPEKADVLTYFERSRDILLKIREGERAAKGHPRDVIGAELPTLKDPGARMHSEEELAEFLKPVPPRSPEEALETFETIDGFHMELVAHEPMVLDPVAAAFDEDGRLYVAEMRDYPYKPREGEKPIGAVRLLRDTDDDGVFDDSHVFADELLWAAGIAPWKGGIFVAAPPDIWYLKDTDGNFKADVRRKVFTGFGTENQQAMLNNLQFGLDHKIYGATAGNGGTVRRADAAGGQSTSVDGRDFRFDPATEAFETESGTIQFGNTFDDWGNRFVCSESRPILHVVLPERYLKRNPYLPVPSAILNIGGGPVPIHRISPIERWRHIRSSRRIAHAERRAESAGASHHVVDAAAGVTIYRGGAYPQEFHGNAFTGDAQNNLVHRRTLIPDGVTFRSERADENCEFVRSSDNWFRPVNFVNAPDGTLYVLDMCREILESIHIPLDVLKHLDLARGRNHGRIYRVAPNGYTYPGAPRLSKASAAELVAALEHPSGWWRETAHRLIYERQDRAAVEPLRRMLLESKSPQTRLHALWSLAGLDALQDEDLLAGLSDVEPRVRAHALALSEPRLDQNAAILGKALARAADENPRVRFQAAFSLGESSDPRAIGALADIAARDGGDQWISTAVMSSVATKAAEMFESLLEKRDFAEGGPGRSMLGQLASVVGSRHNSTEVAGLLDLIAGDESIASNEAFQQELIERLGEGLKRAGAELPAARVLPTAAGTLISNTIAAARETAVNGEMVEEERSRAIRLLAFVPGSESRELLSSLLDPTEPQAVQLAAVRALAGYRDAEIGALLLARWRQYTPVVRSEVIRAVFSRVEWATAYLEAVGVGNATIAELDASQRSQLLEHRNESLRRLAGKVLGSGASSPRSEIVAAYLPAIDRKGDAANGGKVFERECMGCHRLGDKGYAIGPNLATTASHDADALLGHIFDPNRYVLPDFAQYVAVDENGRSYTGMIASQSATSITLKREKDETDTILRGNLAELVATGKSLMPEGFEKKISISEAADLIAFLQAARSDQPQGDRPLDIGTLPGLIEPDNAEPRRGFTR